MPKHSFTLKKVQVVSTWQAQWKKHRDLLLPAPIHMELKSQSHLKCPVPSSPGCGGGNISLLLSRDTRDPPRAVVPQQGQLPRDLWSSRAQKVQDTEQEERIRLEQTPGTGRRAENISLVSGQGFGVQTQLNAIQPWMLLQRKGCLSFGLVPIRAFLLDRGSGTVLNSISRKPAEFQSCTVPAPAAAEAQILPCQAGKGKAESREPPQRTCSPLGSHLSPEPSSSGSRSEGGQAAQPCGGSTSEVLSPEGTLWH